MQLVAGTARQGAVFIFSSLLGGGNWMKAAKLQRRAVLNASTGKGMLESMHSLTVFNQDLSCSIS